MEITETKVTLINTTFSLSGRPFQMANSTSYRTGARNVSAPNAGPGEAL